MDDFEANCFDRLIPFQISKAPQTARTPKIAAVVILKKTSTNFPTRYSDAFDIVGSQDG